MIFAMLGFVLEPLKRVLVPILLGCLVALAGLYAWAQWITVPRLKTERDAARNALVSAQIAADARARGIEAAFNIAQANLRNEYETQIRSAADRLVVVLRQLHDANSDRARLKAAASAPTECREFAASPTQLSVSDAEFLVREADRADRVAVQLQLCQREYASAIEAVNGDESE